MAETDDGRISELSVKLDSLRQSVSEGFDRVTTALAIKVDRHELDDYVRKDVYVENGRRIDGELERLKGDEMRSSNIEVQTQLIRHAQRFWWLPIVLFILKPELLHALASALGGH